MVGVRVGGCLGLDPWGEPVTVGHPTEGNDRLREHIVRPEPVTATEMSDLGANPREVEFRNIKQAFEILAKRVIIPLAKENVDQAFGMCKRHPLEATGLYMKYVFVRLYGRDPLDPLIDAPIKSWTKFRDAVERLQEINWADPVLQQTRSANEIYKGLPGKNMPPGLRDVMP